MTEEEEKSGDEVLLHRVPNYFWFTVLFREVLYHWDGPEGGRKDRKTSGYWQ